MLPFSSYLLFDPFLVSFLFFSLHSFFLPFRARALRSLFPLQRVRSSHVSPFVRSSRYLPFNVNGSCLSRLVRLVLLRSSLARFPPLTRGETFPLRGQSTSPTLCSQGETTTTRKHKQLLCIRLHARYGCVRPPHRSLLFFSDSVLSSTHSLAYIATLVRTHEEYSTSSLLQWFRSLFDLPSRSTPPVRSRHVRSHPLPSSLPLVGTVLVTTSNGDRPR